MLFKISQKYLNDIHIGLGFTLLFTAFNGLTHIQQLLTVSIHQDNPDYNPEGFVTFGIVYIFFTFCVWLAPYFIAVMGCRMSLAFGSICYLSIVTLYYFENNWLTYASGAITGFGASLLWTAQGAYAVLNSEIGKVHSTVCMFFIFFQASAFIGNSFIYWLFDDPNQPINNAMRAEIAIFLGAFVICSSVLFAFLRPPINDTDSTVNKTTFWNEIEKSFKTCLDQRMLLSIPMFFFYGFLLAFLSVIPASLGFSEYLSINSRKFAPLSGVIEGCAQITSICSSWYVDRKSTIKFFFIPIVCICCLIALGTVFLGLPNSSVFTYTDENPIVEMPLCILLLAHFLVTVADSSINIETYDIVGSINPTDSAPAFAMCSFFKNIACTVGYFYSSYFGLYEQVIILMFFGASTLFVYCWLGQSNSLKNVDITRSATFEQKNQKEIYVTY